MPIAHSQPENLAALATIFGVAAPGVERARVLELGCASGGNIIPLAMRYPEARFVGIDLAGRHIVDGRKQIAACKLGNITLHQGDLADPLPEEGGFDYIICHGVFSWVPAATQDAIFRICRERLAPNGVATISFNVLPGWHLRRVIRDLCLEYAGSDDRPRPRVQQARAALEAIATASPANAPYGALLREEAGRLARMPSSYILGEFLAPDNEPCYVKNFIERAGRNGLYYLCEADLAASMSRSRATLPGDPTGAIAGQGRAAIEQHIDFLTGRPFRCSMLVRSELAAQCRDAALPDRLSALHISGTMALEAAGVKEKAAPSVPGAAAAYTSDDPVIRAALGRLSAAYPETMRLRDLLPDGVTDLDSAGAVDLGSADAAGARIGNALLAMAAAGQLSLASVPLRIGRADDARPAVWPLARMEAAAGLPWVTTLRHEGIPVHPLLRALLPHVDGSLDQAALLQRFKAALAAGTIRVPELPAGQPVAEHPELDGVARKYLRQMLYFMERHALLLPPMG